MVKHRVILVIIAVVLIAVLYSLPKVVVDNEGDAGIGADPQETEAGSEEVVMDGDHNFEIADQDQDRIRRLTEVFIEGSGDEKTEAADSLALIYSANNRHDSAAFFLEYIVEREPEVRNFERLGNAYYDSFGFAMDREIAGQLGEKARTYYNKVLEEQPDRLDIRNKIAMTFVSSSNPMQGIMMLRQILEEDPENEMAISNLGMLSIQSGQYERAREHFEKLVSINPRNLKGQFYLGLAYYELGQREEAKRQFELVKSMEDDPAVIATAEGYLQELN